MPRRGLAEASCDLSAERFIFCLAEKLRLGYSGSRKTPKKTTKDPDHHTNVDFLYAELKFKGLIVDVVKVAGTVPIAVSHV